ncbi:MAG: methionyl-tRNA formyltransferase [Gaiellaceae bacterium]
MLDGLGHELAGIVTTRNPRRPDALARVFEAAPAGVDVAVAGSTEHVAALLEAYEPDLALCSGFSWRLTPEALAVPRHGIVNGHPSKLPRWRGPNPFAWTLRANDPELGFTFHFMDEDFDTGNVLAQGTTPLTGGEDAQALRARLPELVPPLLAEALAKVEAGDRGVPQSNDGVTYAPLFEDEFAEIDWTRTVREVHDQCRCWFQPTVSGIMGPLTTLEGVRVRVLETRLVGGEPPTGRLVQCSDGALEVLRTETV